MKNKTSILDALPVEKLDDNNIVLFAREALLKEDAILSCRAISEIFARAEKNQSVLANEVMVAGLIVSTCRSPQFSNQIIDQIPASYRQTIRVRLIIEFIHLFTMGEVMNALDECLDLMLEVPPVIHSALARIVLGGRDDLFLYFIEELPDFSFNFALGGINWLADQSNYTHGPRANPAHLHAEDATFIELVINRGTPTMKTWALGLNQPQTSH